MNIWISKIAAACIAIISVMCLATEQEAFLQGNKLYRAELYQEALNKYERVSCKGPAVWYNIGNCLYKLGIFSYALAAYKSAYIGATLLQRAAIDHNIGRVCVRMGIEKSELLNYRVQEEIVNKVSGVPFFIWQLLFILILFGAVHALKKRNESVHYKVLFVLMVVFIGMVISILFLHYTNIGKLSGIAVKPEVIVYAGPGTGYDIRAQVSMGSQMDIIVAKDDWYKIVFNGTKGWVNKNNLVVLATDAIIQNARIRE